MSDPEGELIPPGEARFEGAEFIDDAARRWHVVEGSDYLRGARWRWETWRERPAAERDPKTGETGDAVWDHDHCHFCYLVRFSERGEGARRDGWATDGPAGLPAAEQQPAYHWVCPECFGRYRDEFGWTVG